jgi:hypothetical protein
VVLRSVLVASEFLSHRSLLTPAWSNKNPQELHEQSLVYACF